jgi:glycosyltransferase involved in cell wall biosynthesis
MSVRNAGQWLDETFESLMEQIIENIHIELSIYNDGSTASDFS